MAKKPRVDYYRYMASREWALKKQQVIDRAMGGCERCLLESDRLQVHHLTYEHLGNEPLEDLQALCRICHEYESGKYQIDPKDVGQWLFYCEFDLSWTALMWGWDWVLEMHTKYGPGFGGILSQAALDYKMIERANLTEEGVEELTKLFHQIIERGRG